MISGYHLFQHFRETTIIVYFNLETKDSYSQTERVHRTLNTLLTVEPPATSHTDGAWMSLQLLPKV